jgi:pyruvate/2-oxoglutarate dehydrogenase complex dihydrolipoamide dehydrogenase (E3) component
VETAGEIGTFFPKASTTILSGGDRLLSRLRPAIGADAQTKLANLGVKTMHHVRVTSFTRTESGQTRVQLSDNTTQTVDVYIDATGGRPNSAWLPSSWLNAGGYVETDRVTMRVKAAKGVYAIGDVASYSLGGVFDVIDAVRPLASSVLVDLSEGKHDGAHGPKQIPFVQKTIKETQMVPIGPKGGVGVLFGWRIPSFMVWMAKARTYFIEKAPGAVEGKDFLKA